MIFFLYRIDRIRNYLENVQKRLTDAPADCGNHQKSALVVDVVDVVDVGCSDLEESGRGRGRWAMVGCCESRWRRRSTLRWKAFSQRPHANGLQPVCLRMCVIRFDDWLNALLHTMHLCGFSPNSAIKLRTLITFLSFVHFTRLLIFYIKISSLNGN